MIYVFTGNDRMKIQKEVEKILGKEYEVFEGSELKGEDLMNICRGTTIFTDERKILVKDLTGKSEVGIDAYEILGKYAGETKNTIVIWETTVSRKKTYRDFVKMKNVSAKKIEMVAKRDNRVFDVYKTAICDGEKAVKMLEEIRGDNDPFMFFGLMASQAIKDYQFRSGVMEKKRLKALAELDMEMKSSEIDEWVLIEGFLLRMKDL
ncbi:MAG: hypothetical protein Q4F60_02845 [Candidatus Saccharibacteria bacterium]|nr:hypothetical protein [Candidatus Saccharibacteria bacterium]